MGKREKAIKKKKKISETVLCCIDRLLSEAKDNYKIHPERTKRYLSLVLKFIRRYKVKLPREKRMEFCKKCLTYWVEGETLKFSENKKLKVKEYECMSCKYKKRIPYGNQ